MLTHLRLQNFRSVLSASLTFPPNGLVVLVGANGSGKTNVVRALEFIAALHHDGLGTAIIEQGGQRSLLPKSIPKDALDLTEIAIEYGIQLSPPPDYPKEAAPPAAQHEVRFHVGGVNDFHVSNEVLEFEQPLHVARALQTPLGTPPDVKRLPERSRIRFSRGPEDARKITAYPKVSPTLVPDYVNWFGLTFLQEKERPIESWRELLQLLDIIQKQLKAKKMALPQTTWLADPLLSLCEHAKAFKGSARNTKRFELQVQSLRAEQQPRRGGDLRDIGDNLPSIVRSLRTEPSTEQSWRRIVATLRDVAPFVTEVGSDLLETGKEYVTFTEAPTGRLVESWDASDGTLRALAVLVAVETQPSYSTMIIEEPEKGLHPWAVRALISHVRAAALRRNVQVVVTTHSPQVLESCEPSEVVVAARTHAEGTTLRPVSDIVSLQGASAGDLGRLWVKGLFGGHPHDTY
jgi:predicted ATPase